VTSGERWTIETPGATTTALIRLDAPAARIPLDGTPRNLAWDATAFFVISGNWVLRIPRADPQARSIVATASMLGELLVVGDDLVWAEPSTLDLDGGGAGRPGRIMTVSTRGGAPRALVSGVDPRALAADGDGVYFSNGDAIEHVRRDGSGRRKVIASTGGTPLLRVDGDWLYYTHPYGVSRVHGGGTPEVVASGIAIPLGLQLYAGEAVVLANAVVNRPYPQYARPAQLVRARPGSAPRVVWSAPDILVADLSLDGTKARFTQRPIGSIEPTLVVVPLE
jgi:hypothetical protein